MGRLLWTEKQDIGPTARSLCGAAYDATRKQVVLFGGSTPSKSLNDTWVWNGELWTQLEDIGPSARSDHALAFDSIRERVVLFGGSTGSATGSAVLADTWEWDGTEWTQMADTGPSGRAGHAMTFDSKIKRVVLFGGTNLSGQGFGDTWSWDGTEWTQEQDTGPTVRAFHALAYDTVRDRVVLFGGLTSDNLLNLNDTWEWEGSQWSQVADTGPAPRFGHGMVFDGARVLLFGGLVQSVISGTINLGDTWSWDGKHWRQIQDIGPGPRGWAAMAYDSDRSRSVLFGGNGQSGFLGDTWELYEHS